MFADLEEADQATVEQVIEAHTGEPSDAQQAQLQRVDNLAGAIATLRQWADDAEDTTVTQGNAVAVLNTVVDRLGVFFNRFANLLENEYSKQI